MPIHLSPLSIGQVDISLLRFVGYCIGSITASELATILAEVAQKRIRERVAATQMAHDPTKLPEKTYLSSIQRSLRITSIHQHAVRVDSRADKGRTSRHVDQQLHDEFAIIIESQTETVDERPCYCQETFV